MTVNHRRGAPRAAGHGSTGVLTAGFLAVVLLLVAVTSAGVLYLGQITSRFHHLVEDQNRRIALMNRMRNAARERSMLLYEMVVTSDPFRRDEQFLALRAKGEVFIKAREQLVALPLDEEERQLLAAQDHYSGLAATHQYRVIDLLQAGQFAAATRVLLQRAVPVQDRAIGQMDRFLALEESKGQQTLGGVLTRYREGYALLVALGVAALVMSGVVAGFVRRRIRLVLEDLSLTGYQLERINEELETRVHRRTRELQRANAALKCEVIEREQAQNALARSESRYRHFVQHFPGIAFQADQRLRPVFVHGDVESITGYKEADFIAGRVGWRQLLLPEDRRVFLREIARPLRRGAGFESERELRIRHRDGQLVWLRGVVRRVDAPPGRPVLIEGAVQDVTERKSAEQALQESEALLRLQTRQLADADRRKDEFLAMLSHELRNPLAPICNAAELLQRETGSGGPSREWAVKVIARQARQLTRLVNDLLAVARITRGHVELRCEPLDLRTVVEDAVASAGPLIDERHHRLRVDLPGEPVFVDADADRLEQVVVNLLNNAARYTEPGGRLRCALAVAGAHACIEVEDNGTGIDADILPYVFEPFTQAARSLDRRDGGLGLGLSLVQGLVSLHGGEVFAESAGPGRGSRFTVHLPLRELPVDAVGAPPVAPGPSLRTSVLVVDDNVDVAESLRLLLESLGHDVHSAHSGEVALEVMARLRPQVVLLDIGMPGMDGYAVVAALRAAYGAAPFVVALTGYGQEDDRRHALAAGFDRHLLKPPSFADIEALFRDWRAARPDRVSPPAARPA